MTGWLTSLVDGGKDRILYGGEVSGERRAQKRGTCPASVGPRVSARVLQLLPQHAAGGDTSKDDDPGGPFGCENMEGAIPWLPREGIIWSHRPPNCEPRLRTRVSLASEEKLSTLALHGK